MLSLKISDDVIWPVEVFKKADLKTIDKSTCPNCLHD